MKEVLQGLFGDVVTEENLLEFGRLFVSRAAFERLQREAAADLALWQAGAKNLTAAKALLAWQDVDLQAADWQERLAEQVRELKTGADTAFLFAREFDVGEDCGWLGLAPAPSDGPLEDVAGLDEREEERSFSADYEYDADGVLRRRQFGQTQKLFPSSDSSWDSYFDGQGRVCYEHGYHTHGGQEYYYIYAGKEEAPAYCLYLDNDCGYYTG